MDTLADEAILQDTAEASIHPLEHDIESEIARCESCTPQMTIYTGEHFCHHTRPHTIHIQATTSANIQTCWLTCTLFA